MKGGLQRKAPLLLPSTPGQRNGEHNERKYLMCQDPLIPDSARMMAFTVVPSMVSKGYYR
jgi:hypothetical protein